MIEIVEVKRVPGSTVFRVTGQVGKRFAFADVPSSALAVTCARPVSEILEYETRDLAPLCVTLALPHLREAFQS